MERLHAQADAIHPGPGPCAGQIGREALRIGLGGPLQRRVAQAGRPQGTGQPGHGVRSQERGRSPTHEQGLQRGGQAEPPFGLESRNLAFERPQPRPEAGRPIDRDGEVAIHAASGTEGGVHVDGCDAPSRRWSVARVPAPSRDLRPRGVGASVSATGPPPHPPVGLQLGEHRQHLGQGDPGTGRRPCPRARARKRAGPTPARTWHSGRAAPTGHAQEWRPGSGPSPRPVETGT